MKKKELIDLLDDTEVSEKIKAICCTRNDIDTEKRKYKAEYLRIKDLYNEIASDKKLLEKNKLQLEKENTELLRKCQSVETLVIQVKNENNSLKEEILSINVVLQKEKEVTKNLKSEIERYNENFEKSVQLFNRFSSISDDIKESLSNTISYKDIMSFIISCSQYNNLESLWNYIKSMYINSEETETLRILKDIFYYFFERYNHLYEEAAYEFDDTEIGDYFDDDKNIKGYNSASSGEITEILFMGYKSVNTGNYIKKSVVRV